LKERVADTADGHWQRIVLQVDDGLSKNSDCSVLRWHRGVSSACTDSAFQVSKQKARCVLELNRKITLLRETNNCGRTLEARSIRDNWDTFINDALNAQIRSRLHIFADQSCATESLFTASVRKQASNTHANLFIVTKCHEDGVLWFETD
jgi:hypothetical protein